MSRSQFLYLNTIGWKTGRNHRIEIWFVEHNKKYYIISEGLDRAHWVRNIRKNPSVSFSVNDYVFKGAARIIDRDKEHGLTAEVSKLMNEKYGWSQGLIVELIPMDLP